jgi:hypothetical protein
VSWRIAKISGSAGSTWRVAKVSGTLGYVQNSWRIARITGTLGGSWRIAKISGALAYTVTPVVATPATQTVDPLTIVTIVGQTSNGIVPDSWSFTSPGITITVVGNTATFQAPGTPTGGTVTVTITATKGANTSSAVTASVIVGPTAGAYQRADGSMGAVSNPYQA